MKTDLANVVEKLELLKSWAKRDEKFIEESLIQTQIDTLNEIIKEVSR